MGPPLPLQAASTSGMLPADCRGTVALDAASAEPSIPCPLSECSAGDCAVPVDAAVGTRQSAGPLQLLAVARLSIFRPQFIDSACLVCPVPAAADERPHGDARKRSSMPRRAACRPASTPAPSRDGHSIGVLGPTPQYVCPIVEPGTRVRAPGTLKIVLLHIQPHSFHIDTC